MGKNSRWLVSDGEEPNREAFPTRPEGHENAYADTPDFGSCPDCPDCGATTGYSYLKSEFKCPNCGRVVSMDEAILLADEPDEGGKPFACRACGGPWPDCRTSCKMFDD